MSQEVIGKKFKINAPMSRWHGKVGVIESKPKFSEYDWILTFENEKPDLTKAAFYEYELVQDNQ